jgi:hypothetical protein
MMSLVRGRMVDKHTLKSPSSVWRREVSLLFIVFTAEKSASHRHDEEKGRRTSVPFFVMKGYSCRRDNQNEAMLTNDSVSVFCRFVFPSAHLLLQQLILLSLTLLTKTDLSPSPRNIYQVTETLSIAFTQEWTICSIKSTRIIESLTFCQLKHFNSVLFFFFWFVVIHSFSFSLKELILSAQVRIYSFFRAYSC